MSTFCVPIYLCKVQATEYKLLKNKLVPKQKHEFEKVAKGFTLDELKENILHSIQGKFKKTKLEINNLELVSAHRFGVKE